MRKHLLFTSAVSGLLIFSAPPVFAACDDNTPATGVTVTCTGADNTGIAGAASDNVTVDVQAGASINPAAGGTRGINLGAGANITVAGSVAGNAQSAIGGTSNLTIEVVSGGSVTGAAGATGIISLSGATITIRSGATVDGGLSSIVVNGGAVDLTIEGTLSKLASLTGSTSSIVRISNGASITGNVLASTAGGADELHWVQDSGDGNFDTDNIGGAATYRNFEVFIKKGADTTTLTGSNALDWTIEAGTLIGAAGNIDAVTVNGGTFGGTAAGDDVTINNGATLAPGNSIGTMNVTGDVDLAAGANYAVEYDNTSADKVVATGNITINNAAILDLTGSGAASTFTADTTYTILEGASVTGTFGTVNNNLAFLDATQNNTGTALEVLLSRNDIDFAETAKDSAQVQAANAVTALGSGNAIFDAFTGLTTVQAQGALDELSGEHNAGVAGAVIESAGALQSTLVTHMTGLSHSGSTGNLAALAPTAGGAHRPACLPGMVMI